MNMRVSRIVQRIYFRSPTSLKSIFKNSMSLLFIILLLGILKLGLLWAYSAIPPPFLSPFLN